MTDKTIVLWLIIVELVFVIVLGVVFGFKELEKQKVFYERQINYLLQQKKN